LRFQPPFKEQIMHNEQGTESAEALSVAVDRMMDRAERGVNEGVDPDWPAAAKMFHRLSPRSGGITLALHWGICGLRRHHPERIKWAAELRRRRALLN
jgi:hypothetical protein